MSVREREDLIQIWNGNSTAAGDATVINKIKQLVPHVQFITHFYKGKVKKTPENIYYLLRLWPMVYKHLYKDRMGGKVTISKNKL